MKRCVTEPDENGLLTTKYVEHHVTIAIDTPVLLYAALTLVVIVFCWWLAHIGLGQVGVGVLSGVLLITTYHYLKAVTRVEEVTRE